MQTNPRSGRDLRARAARRPLLAGTVLVAVAAILGGLLLVGAPRQPAGSPSPSASASGLPALVPAWQLDERWGTYLSEREWGNPREAVGGNGWGLFYRLAGRTDYRFGEDGIAGISDDQGEFDVGWAFWDGRQPYVTERYYGLSNPQGEHGEEIRETRTFQENGPTHAYTREDYRYPFTQPAVDVEMESARIDDERMVLKATATDTAAGPTTIHVVLKGWLPAGEMVERTKDGLLLLGRSSVVALSLSSPPTSWQVSDVKAALDRDLRAGGLRDRGPGHIGALDIRLDLSAGSSAAVRAAMAEARGTDAEARARAVAAADAAVGEVDAVVAARRAEAAATFRGQVTSHEAVYRQALMDVLWNESYYRWDGAGAIGISGNIDAHDVLIMPDKWEYPWVASWDSAFQAVTASLISQPLAEAQLRFLLSDRWQQPDGHVPCAEWVMADECPPILAWSALRVARSTATPDTAFLREVYPALQRQYRYWQASLAVKGSPGLYAAGFLGMDNLPRGGAQPQVDASAWMAAFARDMADLATTLGDATAARTYLTDRTAIAAAVNARLWDAGSKFYYDLASDGTSFVRTKSYAGLVPLIAGIVPADRLPAVLATLRDTGAFLSPGGIRSVPADDPRYAPGYVTGVNSNWLGPVWLPINYLLIEALRPIDPALSTNLRDRVVGLVERDWQATGHFHEYFDGDTGAGLGADAQTGWTALVANLVAEGWPAR